MDVRQINDLLGRGEIDREDMWPRVVEYETKAVSFRFEFGLEELPREPGLIFVRGITLHDFLLEGLSRCVA